MKDRMPNFMTNRRAGVIISGRRKLELVPDGLRNKDRNLAIALRVSCAVSVADLSSGRRIDVDPKFWHQLVHQPENIKCSRTDERFRRELLKEAATQFLDDRHSQGIDGRDLLI